MRIFIVTQTLLCVILLASCQTEQGEKIIEKETIFEKSTGNFMIPTLPDSMELCGEVIDLTDVDIRERLDLEVHANAYYHSSTILYMKRANRFFPAIEEALKAEGLPDDLKYLAIIESGLSQATSPSGAKGFWQFMEGTGKEYGLTINRFVDERLNVSKSTKAACQYLKDAYGKFGEWSTAIASYNRGMGGVKKDAEWQESESYFDTYMNRETGRYLFRMMAIKLIFSDPLKYGFDPSKMEMYEPYLTKTIKVKDGIEDVAVWAKKQGVNYKIIRLLNPWIIGNKLPKKATFEILLPSPDMNLKPISK